MKFLSSLQCICLSFGIFSVSYADDAYKNQEIAKRFAQCDLNHDGKLTKDEAKNCMPRIYDHFGYLDASKRGYLTVAEIQAAADR